MGPPPPGQHGTSRRRRRSEYGSQLREKQKAKYLYGVLETQFKNYFRRAERMPGITGANLLTELERRLDNVAYRLGLAVSRRQARQMVSHRHLRVNGKAVDRPSYQVRPGDVIELDPAKRAAAFFGGIREAAAGRVVPDWLSLDSQNARGHVLTLPRRDHVQEPIDEQLIVNLYSR